MNVNVQPVYTGMEPGALPALGEGSSTTKRTSVNVQKEPGGMALGALQ